VKKPDMRDPDQRDAALMHLGLDGTLADLLRLERVTDFVRAVVLASDYRRQQFEAYTAGELSISPEGPIYMPSESYRRLRAVFARRDQLAAYGEVISRRPANFDDPEVIDASLRAFQGFDTAQGDHDPAGLPRFELTTFGEPWK